MIKETVTISHKELDRLQIFQESVNRHITQEQAAVRIGISVRQVKRLVHRYRNEGPVGLVSRRRRKRPNNAFDLTDCPVRSFAGTDLSVPICLSLHPFLDFATKRAHLSNNLAIYHMTLASISCDT